MGGDDDDDHDDDHYDDDDDDDDDVVVDDELFDDHSDLYQVIPSLLWYCPIQSYSGNLNTIITLYL
ncbi:hypothetical protein DPMN_021079 [Dreissena polymorpha]|uniref:Uncharacterized protein n=1 Tax=Dreissena polymorpha TaxID=45954 RepID=A0A9D4SAT4_DREPO|nr:hypothetical protein DPMN_021079 [Dreissena polymorpha]